MITIMVTFTLHYIKKKCITIIIMYIVLESTELIGY